MTDFSKSQEQNEALILLRRVEGAAIGLAAILLFAQVNGDWWLFAALLLVPDVAMAGYVVSPRVGAHLYNAAHTYLVPVALGLICSMVGFDLLVVVGSIWVAHIGLDRALGYGLKHTTGFHDTHLSKFESE
ncbi:MAG: DUF4260 domain-containing protein [Pseudomonadota bacterium]